jgi:mRNA interferase RelE/StbE
VAHVVFFTPAARRQLKKLPREVQQRIGRKVDSLARDPHPVGSVKLTGGNGESLYRFRVGAYRVLYQVRDRELLVLVVKVGHPQGVYRK